MKKSIRPLSDFRRNWLAQAEHSASGISFFFLDAWEREAFCELTGLDQTEALELASKYELVPRTWIKLHPDGGFSQYHVVEPSNRYPITTLRMVLRRYGRDPGGLEEALLPALESPTSLFAFILKGAALRLSAYIERERLPALLRALPVDPEKRRLHLEHDPKMGKSPGVYVTFEPGNPEVLSVDYQRYVKLRFVGGEPQLTPYRPLPETLSQEELSALCAVPPMDVERYYDGIEFPTYQAALLPGGARETVLDLARKAGVESGMRVLDAGCGVGEPAQVLQSEFGLDLEAITLSAPQAEKARGRGVKALQGDYHQLPYPDATFDRVLFLESFCYAAEPACALAEARRVLKPGGKLFLKEPLLEDRALTPAERLELAEYDRVWGVRTRRLEEIRTLLGDCRLDTLEGYTTEAFYRQMQLNPDWGRRHFRRYQSLPVKFWGLLS